MIPEGVNSGVHARQGSGARKSLSVVNVQIKRHRKGKMEMKTKASKRNRDWIYQAAVVDFQKNVFSKPSMGHISARPRPFRRTFYKYFKTIEKLFQKLLRRHCGRFAASLDVTRTRNPQVEYVLRHVAAVSGANLALCLRCAGVRAPGTRVEHISGLDGRVDPGFRLINIRKDRPSRQLRSVFSLEPSRSTRRRTQPLDDCEDTIGQSPLSATFCQLKANSTGVAPCLNFYHACLQAGQRPTCHLLAPFGHLQDGVGIAGRA